MPRRLTLFPKRQTGKTLENGMSLGCVGTLLEAVAVLVPDKSSFALAKLIRNALQVRKER